MTSTSEAVSMCTRRLAALRDAGSQCDYLVTLGLQKSPVGPIKADSNRTNGCQTAIWINVKGAENCLHFTNESGSLLVCGILAIYENLYDRKSQREVSSNPPDFLGFISNEVIYPEIERNRLLKCYKILCAFQKINHNNKGE